MEPGTPLAPFHFMLKRQDLLRMIHVSFQAERSDYVRALGRNWLQLWPNDTKIQYQLARAYVAEDQTDAALGILTELVSLDPEHAAAQRLLGDLAARDGMVELSTVASGVADLLQRKPLPETPWLQAVQYGRDALGAGEWDLARRAAEQALLAEPPTPLPSLLLLQAHWLAGEYDLAQPLAHGFCERWAKCVALSLCLADCLLHNGEHALGVERLHTTATLDPAGEIVARYWGREHPYRAIWPPAPTMPPPGPIPPEVATLLGTNRLHAGDDVAAPDSRRRATIRAGRTPRRASKARPNSPEGASQARPTPPPAAAPETLRNIEAELKRVAAQLKTRRRSPRARSKQASRHRRPVHVLLTSKKNLAAKYGSDATSGLLSLVTELARVTAQFAHRPTLVVMPDEFATLSSFPLDPVDPTNPWEIKLLLHDLNAALARRGQTIGSLLIVGGDDIVPFHRLPNPTDDVDADVPSDNPYGALDENYFVLDWPVGRLPAPCNPDTQALAGILQHTIDAHRAPAPRLRFPLSLVHWLFPTWRPGASGSRSFGYSADVWKKASRAVYDAIGDPWDLLTSPPLEAARLPDHALAPADLSYFNLHGLEDSPDWYGQHAILDPEQPLYPLALRPADVLNTPSGAHGSGRAPHIVLSEACYGGNILNKRTSDEAMCLRFLAAGSRAVVGSTRLSYGSIARPLIAADLLGFHFWEALLSGLPVGETLRRAKLNFAKEMHDRQGFLDGEDQKTLISFVLYGDPLLLAPNVLPAQQQRRSRRKRAKNKGVSLQMPPPVCTKGRIIAPDAISAASQEQAETLTRVKTLVSKYLPGMEQCEVNVYEPLASCSGHDHQCATSQFGPRGNTDDPEQRIYTLSKSVPVDGHTSHQYARVTVDKRGEVIKLAVTR